MENLSSLACGGAPQKRIPLSLWVFCVLWGLVGAIGVYAQDHTALIGGREAIRATYKDVERELEEIDGNLRALEPQRTVTQV